MPKSVIVIDDDEDTVRLFSEFLQEHGVNVVGSGFDGISAVKLFQETKPDVILIDLNMPNGSGFYAIKKIQEINPNARIIAVSADGSYSTEEKLDKLNIPLIQKPFKMDQVISTIES
ncbi:response regulator receiver domain protein [Candidatus Nitrosopumilus salaria BD31]|uniref:Response regulator receiver domain protein n=1 Tax=Candidatus Nitrosopumilus salarius BD31 TaxID=859350 RepID=I3D0S3_9ARCH|nr:response regulator [Candidatus Nitrosopumilus salaria]EIJ65316.1 response regulator receiver domain protein [Candidatus Nitrosopumilus salaria BD31]